MLNYFFILVILMISNKMPRQVFGRDICFICFLYFTGGSSFDERLHSRCGVLCP
jgi:hypothetical protein